MSLLEQYEQQYATVIADITANIGKLQLRAGHDHKDLCGKIDNGLTEAAELLEQMGLEIRDLNNSQRPAFTSKLNCAQMELKRLQNDYKNAKEKQRNAYRYAAATTTIDLNSSNDDYFEDVSIDNDQRQRLLENSDRIERTGNRLTDGYRIALESEAIGAQVLNDLHHQRETLQSARSRLRETNADLGRASRTLNSLMSRALREKAVLYGVGICFVLIVVLTIYLSFFSTSATPKTD